MTPMDKKLQIVLHLYGEADDRAAFRRLLEDEEVRAEHQAMSEVKFALDHARPRRPAPAVLARIAEAAAHPERLEASPPRRRDRMPVRLRRRRAWQWAGAAVVVVLAVGFGLGRFASGPDAPHVASSERPASLEQAERLRTAPAGRAQRMQAKPAAVRPDAALEWDGADEVWRLHRRIERLRARNAALRWGEPAVPLEMLPSVDPGVGLRPAGSRPPGR